MRLGAYKFTMDEDMSEAVMDILFICTKKGWIYRGVRMVNWDPQGKTAVSDEEVIRKEVNQKLYYITYPISEELKVQSEKSELSTLNFQPSTQNF
jgi:valyl-tRNA synthetase